MLALTFSRKAAEQLRDRVTARLGRTMATTLSSTFHSFAYGLVRRYSTAELYAAPLRLLSAPEQDVILQELLAGVTDRVVVAITFLALLELVKGRELTVEQTEPWGPIAVRRREGLASDDAPVNEDGADDDG